MLFAAESEIIYSGAGSRARQRRDRQERPKHFLIGSNSAHCPDDNFHSEAGVAVGSTDYAKSDDNVCSFATYATYRLYIYIYIYRYVVYIYIYYGGARDKRTHNYSSRADRTVSLCCASGRFTVNEPDYFNSVVIGAL